MMETSGWPLIALLLLGTACGGGQRAKAPRIEPGWYVAVRGHDSLPARPAGSMPAPGLGIANDEPFFAEAAAG